MRRTVIALFICISSLACVLGTVPQGEIPPVESPAHTAGSPAASTATVVPIVPAASPVPSFTWTTYTTGDNVNDMAFDSAGNLWAATSGGAGPVEG
jgi:hypothetical protein